MYLVPLLYTEDWFLILEQIDEIILAELPTPADDPTGELQTIIRSSMLYGPCGPDYPKSPCMQSSRSGSSRCGKQFPKSFPNTTIV